MIRTAERRDLMISERCMAQPSRSAIMILDYNFVQGLTPYMKGYSQGSIGGYLKRI